MTSGLIHRPVPPVVNVMTVSFGSTEARDEVTAPNPSDSRKAEVSDADVVVPVDLDVSLDERISEVRKYPTCDYNIPLSDLRGRGEGRAYMPSPS